MLPSRIGRRSRHSIYRRALLAVAIILFVLAVGTLGMCIIEGLSLVDSFYFMAMLATAQGPPTAPQTVAGKLFAALMAFVSVGSVVAALGFIFGPFFGALWHVGVLKIEEEEGRLAKKGERNGDKDRETPPEN
jgi:hypothetical protein